MRRKTTGNIIMAGMAALMLTACANSDEPIQKEDEILNFFRQTIFQQYRKAIYPNHGMRFFQKQMLIKE